MREAKVLKKLRAQFDMTKQDSKKIINAFHLEMKKGLEGRTSSLKMIPTYVDKPTGREKGKFIALDLGGTNFRVLELELKGAGAAMLPKVMKFSIDKRHMTGDGRKLFGFIARCIKKFMNKERLPLDKEIKLGFTFSFPVKQTGINSGTLLQWTKGFSAAGVVGKDVVILMEKALSEEGISNVNISALANDTVGTLVSLGYKYRDCDIGIILGTGTNACYREKVTRLTAFRRCQDVRSYKNEYMIVNTEWGNFNKLRRNIYDQRLDKASRNPSQQLLEKMVSGMFLGEIVRLIILDLVKDGKIFNKRAVKAFQTKDIFKTEYMSIIESDRSKKLAQIQNLLRRLGVSGSSLNNRNFLKDICEIVSLRGAKVSAFCTIAVITHMDPGLKQKHIIALDGSVYEKHPGFSKNMAGTIKEFCGKKAYKIRMMLAKDGSGKGAAIIAAVA